MPDDDDSLIVGGVGLPRLALDSGQSACDQALAVEERLAVLTAENRREWEFRLNIAPQCTKMGALDFAAGSIGAESVKPID